MLLDSEDLSCYECGESPSFTCNYDEKGKITNLKSCNVDKADGLCFDVAEKLTETGIRIVFCISFLCD